MPSPIQTYFENAQFSLAAYADLAEGMTTAQYITELKEAGFTDSQATRFAATYSIVSVSPPNVNGFSAVLFQKNDGSSDRFLAIRGTNDPFDAFTDVLDIALLGSTDIQAQYASLEAFYTQLKDELKLMPAHMLTVTGHSLGGFLAQTFTADHADVASTYTYNAPGIGGSVLQVLELLGVTPGALSFPNITNVVGQGPSLISGFGTYLGTVERAFIEGSLLDPIHNHSIGTITDALALYDLFARVDPNVSLSSVTDILNASSTTAANSLESGLDAVRKLFQGPTVITTPVGDRDAYYSNLIALRDSLPATSPYRIDSLTGLSSSTVFSQAKSSTADGLAYRYALRELNPFAVMGANYSLHNTGGALDLYDAQSGNGTMTALYLSDRAELLTKRLAVNVNDGGTVPTDTHYVDVRTGFEVGSVASANEVIFGDAQDNRDLLGHAGGDHLYGGDGNDLLTGQGGMDYLEGNAGDDEVYGGTENDILLGQQGDDQLYGEAGNDRLNGGLGDDRLDGGTGLDTYVYRTGQGQDTIVDADKSGTILFDNQTLVGGIRRQGTPADTYVSPDGQFTYLKSGTNLLINNTLTIENFDFQTGALGIKLADTGTLASSDLPTQGPVEATIQGTPLSDFLHHEGFAINDLMSGGLGNDWFEPWFGDDRVFGEGGDDFLRGGTGRDVLDGGDGIDRLEGDASQLGDVLGVPDQDYLDGGAGDDLLFGGLRNTFVMVKRAA